MKQNLPFSGFLCSAILFLTMAGCSSNFLLQLGSGTGQAIQLAPPSAIATTASGAFAITQVVKNASNPSGILDVIGDSTGTLGNLCGIQSGSSGSSSCNCSFGFSTTSNPNQKIEVPVIYSEVNLVRCSYAVVPSNATTISFSVHLTTADVYSNTITLNLNQTAGSALDLTQSSSYNSVTRYQCRRLVTIPLVFSSSLYDPFQSEDFNLFPSLIPIYVKSANGTSATIDSSFIAPAVGWTLQVGSDKTQITAANYSGNMTYSLTLSTAISSHTTVSGFLDPSVSRPLPRISLTYPLNYYATNLSAALAAISTGPSRNSDLSFFSCPPILNYSKYLNASDATQFEADNRLNLKIFSSAPLVTNPPLALPDSKLIYPVTPSVSPTSRPPGSDRSTFYLAKSPAGLFGTPVDSYISPGTVSSSDSSTTPSLGYGANPIPLAGGAGETCPSASQQPIPAGFHWVKIWLFRGSLPQRHYFTPGSNSSSPKIIDVGAIACNPGVFNPNTQGGTATPIYSSCPHSGPAQYLGLDNSAIQPPLAISLEQASPGNTNFLADRVMLSTNQCVRMDSGIALNGSNWVPVPGPTANPSPSPSPALSTLGTGPLGCQFFSSLPGASCPTLDSSAASGLDRWLTWYVAPDSSTSKFSSLGSFSTSGCGQVGFSKVDPLNLCANEPATARDTSRLSIVSLTGNTSSGQTKVVVADGDHPVMPMATQYGIGNLDTSAAQYDYIFVVTPQTVMVKDMINSTSVGLQYFPYRFKTKEDCVSNDPDNPAPGDCQPIQKITYSIKLHDVGSPEDPPGTSTTRAGDFPICAIQPNP